MARKVPYCRLKWRLQLKACVLENRVCCIRLLTFLTWMSLKTPWNSLWQMIKLRVIVIFQPVNRKNTNSLVLSFHRSVSLNEALETYKCDSCALVLPVLHPAIGKFSLRYVMRGWWSFLISSSLSLAMWRRSGWICKAQKLPRRILFILD